MVNVISRSITSTIMMSMEGLTIICMMVVGWKVYKIDKFKNKYIFFLILLLNLSLFSDFIDWLVIINGHGIKDKHSQHLRQSWHHFLEYLTITFMNVALKINLRIWISYTLKIKLMGSFNRDL